MSALIQDIPVVALRGVVLLPGAITHFDVSRDMSIQAVKASMRGDSRLFLSAQKDLRIEHPEMDDLNRIGVLVEVKQLVKLKDDILRVIVDVKEKGELLRIVNRKPYLTADVAILATTMEYIPADVQEAMVRSLKDALLSYAGQNKKVGSDLVRQLDSVTELNKVFSILGNSLPFAHQKKQELLNADSAEKTYEILLGQMLREIEILEIQNDIQRKVKAQIDKNQREYVLREQMKIIREELGEDNLDSDIREFEEAIEKLEADDAVKERLKKEVNRYRNVAGNASEASVIRTYIETILELPWNKRSKDYNDLKNARRILDEDHYGLQKVKERVLEFLAVRNLTDGGQSPIICLVGPPGTGKTSIARSVATALNKQYERISLGGVRDEAEIRGHRRTYVGAMPGRIAQAMKNAGVKNPLILLDEIDKMSSDYKGDTASAMLEVLDGEQNNRFKDHYVDMPMDLSEVLFICTANDMSTIPKPLLDRMELIEVSSYTANEKLHIAKNHLVEKQKQKNGLQKNQLRFSDKALEEIIAGYTREAGVRSLERKIGEICRKAALQIYEGDVDAVSVKKTNLEELLGKRRFQEDGRNTKDEVGIVRGLAWTSVGGTTLQIEVNIMPGKGEFKLTGQLGDVMKESAQAGISYIRSISEVYSIPEDYFTKHDIHIHIPEGAVPKDGPSAGITMATAMLSAITDTKVKADVAMTGEITLRGNVLPIGGLKEKLLAANMAGMKTICIPEKNRPDLAEIDEEIKAGMDIICVSTMAQVIKTAFVQK